MLAHPDHHELALASIFGGLYHLPDVLDDAGAARLDRSHPWLLQTILDLRALGDLDDAAEIIETHTLPDARLDLVQLLTTSRHLLLAVDPAQLRYRCFASAVPPPGTAPSPLLQRHHPWLRKENGFATSSPQTVTTAEPGLTRPKPWQPTNG